MFRNKNNKKIKIFIKHYLLLINLCTVECQFRKRNVPREATLNQFFPEMETLIQWEKTLFGF